MKESTTTSVTLQAREAIAELSACYHSSDKAKCFFYQTGRCNC
jgi:hypothetical protein